MGLGKAKAEKLVRAFLHSNLDVTTVNYAKDFSLVPDTAGWVEPLSEYLSTSIHGAKVGVRLVDGRVELFKKGGRR